MSDVMKRLKILSLLLGVVWLWLPLSAGAETWPIKEFKVFQKKPGDLTSTKVISSQVATEIERWLKRVAQEYESMGFKKPTYGKKKESILSSKDVFPVYVYPYSTGAQAAMGDVCNTSRNNQTGKVTLYKDFNPIMIADSGRIIKNGKLTSEAYQDFAHELFHAVQNSYSLFNQDCNAQPGGWISEGTAEAVGIEMARKLKGIPPNHICQMGVRSFSERLYVQPKRSPIISFCSPASRPYQTQSFWQYLGEYITRKHVKKKLEAEEFVTPDFRYLHRFFNTTHPMGSQSKEYAWLDKVLYFSKRYGKNQFGSTLHTVYSRFVGTFSSYWKPKRRNRYPAVGSGTAALKEKRWNKLIFGTCMEVQIKKGKAVPPIALPIGPVAARCIKVNFNVRERVKLTFNVSGGNQSLALESLAISTAGGKKIVRRHPGEQHPNKLGHFIVSPAPNRMVPEVYFIVSNVAQDAGQTVSLSPSIRIVPEIVSSSMAKAKKKPGPIPTPKEELENSLESHSWMGQAYQKQRPPCSAWSFEARPCGPVTRLELALESDLAKNLAESIQPPMSLDRPRSVFGAIAQKGGDQVVTDLTAQQMEILQQDGAMISMTLPQIQLGFTGTISNAHMSVSKAVNPDGSDNGGYRAVGAYVGDCGKGYYPANGTVTIKEFSKYVMRGTFSAHLKDAKVLNSVQYCGSVPVARPISGDFTITDIDWGKNQSTPKVGDDAIIDRTVEDINEVLPGLITEDLRQQAKDRAKAQKKKNKQQKKSKGGRIKQCNNCQCHLEPVFCQSNPQSPCCQFCDPIFNMCKGNQPSPKSAHSPSAQAKEAAKIQVMRKKYEAYVDSIVPNPAIKKMMMDTFDRAKTINEKKIFMMAIP